MEVKNSTKNIIAKQSDFSINYILNSAGESQNRDNLIDYSHDHQSLIKTKTTATDNVSDFHNHQFQWLQYTRYKPPKLPRTFRINTVVKRTPGRLPRIPFTPTQLNCLETAYKQSTYLSTDDANRLAYELNLTSIRVKIWFQNRRARERREKREITVIERRGGGKPSPITTTFIPAIGFEEVEDEEVTEENTEENLDFKCFLKKNTMELLQNDNENKLNDE